MSVSGRQLFQWNRTLKDKIIDSTLKSIMNTHQNQYFLSIPRKCQNIWQNKRYISEQDVYFSSENLLFVLIIVEIFWCFYLFLFSFQTSFNTSVLSSPQISIPSDFERVPYVAPIILYFILLMVKQPLAASTTFDELQ